MFVIAPPSSNNSIDAIRYVKDLCDCIDCVYPNNCPVIICGDLNCPYIDWSADNCSLCSNLTYSGVFLEFYYNHGLHQYVNLPIRFENILDLVLCNDVNCVYNVKPVEPFGTSDHNQVQFGVLHSIVRHRTTFLARNFKVANWAGIKLLLNNVDFLTCFTVIYLRS